MIFGYLVRGVIVKKKASNIINEYNNIKLLFELNIDNNTYIENKVKEFSKKHLFIEYNENIDKNMITHEKAFKKFKTYYKKLDITETTTSGSFQRLGLLGDKNNWMNVSKVKAQKRRKT